MDIGKTSVAFRRERSFHGLDPRALKSALQKYARRGEREKALWCLVEMDLFSLGLSDLSALARSDRTSPNAARRRIDALRSNLVNRLVVMVSEEVSVHSPWLPVAAREHYERWSAVRDTPASREHLVAFYLLLLEADKCRIVSDYKTAFNLAPYYLPEEHHGDLVALHRAFLRERDPALYRVNYEQATSGLSAAELAARALDLALAGSDEALFWCGRLLEHREAARGVSALWRSLVATGIATDVLRALEFFYRAMSHREKPIYLYHALLLVAFRDRLDLARPSSLAPRERVDVEALYAEHTARPAPALDAFVFDLHTGVRREDGRASFAQVGAHVERESTRFLNPRYRAHYVAFKTVLDQWSAGRIPTPDAAPRGGAHSHATVTAPRTRETATAPLSSAVRDADAPREIESLAAGLGVPVRAIDADEERAITELPRAQKRTATSKKAVFVARDAVYKGPYAPRDAKLRNNLVNTALVARVESWLGVATPTVVPWRALLRTSDGGYYLCAENLGDPDAVGEWAVVSSKIETDVRVLARGSFVTRVSELEKEPLTTPAAVWVATLQHLYVLYLLGIGDEGSHNVVVATDGRVVGIDLEEFRSPTRAPADRLAALFKRVAAHHRALYPAYLERIRTFERALTAEQQREAIELGCEPLRVAAIQERIAAFASLAPSSTLARE